METQIYNHKNMSIYDLKDLLEEYPLNLLYDYFEIKDKKNIKEIFFKDVKFVTSTKNSRLKFYLKDNNIARLKANS
jgi:hypothetical protein